MALYGFKFEIAEMVFGGASRESGRLAHGHVTVPHPVMHANPCCTQGLIMSHIQLRL